VKYLTNGREPFDPKDFEEACGIGQNYTAETIRKRILEILDEAKSLLEEKRYAAMHMVYGKVRSSLKFADGLTVKQEFDKALEERLGPRTKDDNTKKPKKTKKKKATSSPQEETKDESKTANVAHMSTEDLMVMFSGRSIPWDKNSEEIKCAHIKRTGGKMRTRFPPEPNGYLHIGHAKAMNFNFGVAKKFGGVTFLRFDDTNPEAEKKEYIDNIIENVKYMGHNPYKITYSSDSFQKLYDFAVYLIKKDKAYVCHMTGEKVKESKKLKQNQPPSPWRDRPVEESLFEFDRMRKGYYGEGKATLRLKMDITHDNPNMWDIIAYRIIFKEHPHAGRKWCIYPTYDFTHCIIDSLEDITHSCCTMEFENRRESYYWLLDELNIFKPNVWEYGRLNIKSNVLSKRKLKQLVVEGHVKGWDDPRLLTINGLRRRGFTAEGINQFCEDMGVSRAVVSWAPYERLEQCGRAALNIVSPRRMVILDPLRVELTNLEKNRTVEVECRNFPESLRELGVEDEKTFKVSLTRTLYIERKDFRKSANKSYFGLTPGKTVRLLHAFNITCERIDEDEKGNPKTLYCTIDIENKIKIKKGFLHWVSGSNPIRFTANLYDKLFLADYPGLDEDGEKVHYLTQLNPKSLEVARGIADQVLSSAKPGEHYQFERLGFFFVDPDSTPGNIIFNRTMSLSAGRAKKMKK